MAAVCLNKHAYGIKHGQNKVGNCTCCAHNCPAFSKESSRRDCCINDAGRIAGWDGLAVWSI
jgi:hypothetical protein